MIELPKQYGSRNIEYLVKSILLAGSLIYEYNNNL